MMYTIYQVLSRPRSRHRIRTFLVAKEFEPSHPRPHDSWRAESPGELGQGLRRVRRSSCHCEAQSTV